jgi:hypothetical protein
MEMMIGVTGLMTMLIVSLALSHASFRKVYLTIRK